MSQQSKKEMFVQYNCCGEYSTDEGRHAENCPQRRQAKALEQIADILAEMKDQ